jgi:hypothetical protein
MVYFVPKSFYFNYSMVTEEIVICQTMTETGVNVFGMLDYSVLDNIADDLLRLYKREKYRYKFTYMNIFEFQIIGQAQFESVLIEIAKRLTKIDEFDGITILLDD